MDSVGQHDSAAAHSPRAWGMLAPLLVLVLLVGMTVGLPVLRAGWDALTGPAPASPAAPTTAARAGVLMLNTAAYALAIGVLATVLAWPAAWALRRGSGWGGWAAAVAVPLLLPNYLAYAALNLLRAPRTWLGDWSAHWAPEWQLVLPRAFAVIGLALWAWPLAAIVLGSATSRVPRSVLEMLALDGAGPVRRTLLLGRMLRGPMVLAAAVVALVMLGSAVPLHVAQIDTYAANLWLLLNLDHPAAVWRTTWPLLLVIAGLAAVIAARLFTGSTFSWESDEGDAGAPAGLGRGWFWLALVVWCASVMLPLALFVMNLRPPGAPWSLSTAVSMSTGFWRMSGEAVGAGLLVSAGAAMAAAAIALSSWAVFSIPPAAGRWARMLRGAAMTSTGLWLITALVPGVLVGTAVARLWNLFPGGEMVADSPVVLVLAHGARFGFIPALVGLWLASLEPRAERDARALDGAVGLRGWWMTRGANLRAWGAVAGAGVAVAALSFHEIEAAVIVQPPGVPSLPQQILDHLHFARDERLAAAAVNLIGLGIIAAAAAGWLVGKAAGRSVAHGRRRSSRA